MEGYAWEACCEHWASIAQGGEIFLVYGHSSHEDFLANAKLADKGITIVTFDPNCTHVYQVGGVREAARSSCRNRVCAVGYMYVHYSMLGISLSCVMGLEGGRARMQALCDAPHYRTSLHFAASTCFPLPAPRYALLPSLAHKDTPAHRRCSAYYRLRQSAADHWCLHEGVARDVFTRRGGQTDCEPECHQRIL